MTAASPLPRLLTAAVACAGAVVLLAACGGSSNTASSSGSSSEHSPSPSPSPSLISSVDACKLVTAADATTAAGAEMTNQATGGAQIPGACIYANTTTGASVFVYAMAYPDTTQASAVDLNAVATGMLQTSVTNVHQVSGIGDKALEFTGQEQGQGGIGIFVIKSNVVMFIVIGPTSDPTKVEALARTAVSRL